MPVLTHAAACWSPLVRARTRRRGGLRIVGITDDRYERSGRYLNDVPVLDRLSDLQPILVGLVVQGAHPRRSSSTAWPARSRPRRGLRST